MFLGCNRSKGHSSDSKRKRNSCNHSLEDLKLLQKLEDQIDLKDALLALKESNEKGVISLEKFKE